MKMADGKHSGSKNFSKVLQKTVSRTKEKVLQNLGKADKTQDEDFDTHVVNFNKQQLAALKVQKELKNYLQCVKAMSLASKVFYEMLRDTYEDEWTGHSDMMGAVEALSAMWEDYLMKLTNQVQEPISAYVSRFPDTKHKIAKRNRKLMDYDGTRHTRETFVNQKKKDEAKISKAHDEMNAAKKIYYDINAELHEELPSFYDSRKSVLASSFNSLFASEAKFQEESAKIKNTLADVTERLNRESSDVFFKQFSSSPHSMSSDHGSTTHTPPIATKYHPHITNDTSSNRSNSNRSNSSSRSDKDSDGTKMYPGLVLRQEVTTEKTVDTVHKPSPADHSATNGEVATDTTDTSAGPASPEAETEAIDTMYENIMLDSQTTQNTVVDDEDVNQAVKSSLSTDTKLNNATNNNKMKLDDSDQEITVQSDEVAYSYVKEVEPEEIYNVPSSNEPVVKTEPGILYMVEATHPYAGEDIDELTFEIGDKINVMQYDDPEEQDDGWLMGVKIPGNEKGVFPENFTKRIV